MGFLIGFCLYILGGPLSWIALTVFFLTGTVLGRIKKAKRKALSGIVEKSGARDWVQVMANCLPAVAMLVMNARQPHPAWLIASFTALSSAAADTWASEIGVLSATKPRSILNGKYMEPGLSGGVTALGTALSLGGALLIAFIACLNPLVSLKGFSIIAIGGFTGSLIDSVLGASVQAKYLDPVSGLISEKMGANTLIAGKVWMTNDMVNFLSNAAASCLALFAATLVL